MKDSKSGPIYFILGLLVVAVLVIGYFVIERDSDPAPVVVTQTDSGNDSGEADTSNDNASNDNADSSDDSGSSFDLTIGDDGVSVSTETNN